MKKLLVVLITMASLSAMASDERYDCIESVSEAVCAEVTATEGFVNGGKNVKEMKCAMDIVLRGTSGRLYLKEISTSTHIDEKTTRSAADLKAATASIYGDVISQYNQIKYDRSRCK